MGSRADDRDYESVNDMAYARKAFEHGARLKEVSCLYRMGMAHLLGQLGIPVNPAQAVPLLQEAADLSNADVPHPAYVFGMLLLDEFAHVQLPPALLTQMVPARTQANPHPRGSEARRRIERSAYLGFGPALYKIGWAYEHAKIGCAYDPLLSVQYYSAASQRGDAEADMSLSKWFSCGSEGFFDKDENLAVVFAEKAANRGNASGMFAMGYYNEVGVGVRADRNEATKWYRKASAAGNTEAASRLAALATPGSAPLSHAEYEAPADSPLVGRHPAPPGGGFNSPPRMPSQAGRHLQRYTLTDEGFQTPPSSQASASPAPVPMLPSVAPHASAPAWAFAPLALAPQSPAAAPSTPAFTAKLPKKGPQGFAAVGFRSSEDKECVIM